MGKFVTYIILMGFMDLVFNLAGLIPTSSLLSLLVNPSSIMTSQFWLNALNVISLVTLGGGVIYGFITRNIELVTISPFIVYMANLMFDFLAVYNSLASENQGIAILIFSVFFLVWIVTCVEWWRGRD